MALFVACTTCHRDFPLDSHAGLVRCDACAARAGLHLPVRDAGVVEFHGAWA